MRGAPGASPGPRDHPVSCPGSDADDEDERHCVTAAEAREARAAKAAAAKMSLMSVWVSHKLK